MREASNALDPQVAIFLMQEIVKLVADLHAKDIVFSDLKPENIMALTDEKGKIVGLQLIDAGGAAIIGSQYFSNVVEMTAHFAPPEFFGKKEAKSELAANTSIDIFSLGVNLLILCNFCYFELLKNSKPGLNEHFLTRHRVGGRNTYSIENIKNDYLDYLDYLRKLKDKDSEENLQKDLQKYSQYKNSVKFPDNIIEDLFTLIKSMVEVNPKGRPAIKEILIKIEEIASKVKQLENTQSRGAQSDTYRPLRGNKFIHFQPEKSGPPNFPIRSEKIERSTTPPSP